MSWRNVDCQLPLFRNMLSLDAKDDNTKTHWIIDCVLYPKHQQPSHSIYREKSLQSQTNFSAKIGRLPTYWVAGRGSFDLRFEESWTWSMVRLSDKMMMILTPLSVIIPLGYDGDHGPPDDFGPAEWDIMFLLQSELDVFVKINLYCRQVCALEVSQMLPWRLLLVNLSWSMDDNAIISAHVEPAAVLGVNRQVVTVHLMSVWLV